MTGATTPSGWYPDPNDSTKERWWDGTAWGDGSRPAGGSFGSPLPPAPAPPSFAGGHGYGYAPQGGGQAASFGQRFVAALIDGVIVGVAVQVVVLIGGAISDTLGLLLNIVGFVAGVVYYIHFEGGATGQTIGKKAMNIRVVDAVTMQPGIGGGKAAGRYFARILSSIPCALGYFWMLWDAEKQTWHDKIVATRVTVG